MRTEEILWNAYFETVVTAENNDNTGNMDNELEALYKMTDEQACEAYNVDNKAEAEILIREYWG
jgi:hypothetical protein